MTVLPKVNLPDGGIGQGIKITGFSRHERAGLRGAWEVSARGMQIILRIPDFTTVRPEIGDTLVLQSTEVVDCGRTAMKALLIKGGVQHQAFIHEPPEA